MEYFVNSEAMKRERVLNSFVYKIDWEKRPRRQPVLGITCFIIASVFLALVGAVAKLIGETQTATAVVFWRNLVGLILISPYLFFRKEPIQKQLKTSSLTLQLIRGTSSFLAVLCYFYSLKFIPLSDATLLLNTIPIFVPLVALIWQRVALIKSSWWGLGVAFLGIVIALRPGIGIFHAASLIALLSGIIGAIAFVSLRLGQYSDTSFRMMFYLFSISIVLGLIFSLFSFEETWRIASGTDFFLLVLVGIFGLLYQISITLGAKFIPVRLGTIFIYFSVIFSFFLDKWLWKSEIEITTYIGFLLIVIGAILKVALYPKDDLKLSK